jgi:pimeloyl-ACP methyl ester carboxylesterase
MRASRGYPIEVELFGGIELPDGRSVDVGVPVHYREWPGPADGPTFVCVHGLGGSHLNWAGVAPELSRIGRTIALDLGGFGLTPPSARGTSVGANWRLLGDFLGALDLPPVILVGNSMGGMISLIQAAHSPKSVSSLVLVDAAFPRARVRSGQPAPRVAGVFALYASGKMGEWFVRARAKKFGPEGLVRETFRICAADPSSIDPVLVEAHVEMARLRLDFDYAAEAFLAAARSIFRTHVSPTKYRALVRSVVAPALVIHGAKDALVPVGAAREAASEHENWKLVVFDDLGHIPMMEAPGRWLDAVESWLEAAPRLRGTG